MKYRSGYSLVEVIVALALFSVAIFPIMSLFPVISKNNSSASDMQEAARIGTQIIEFIKAKGYRNLMNTGSDNVNFTGLTTENGTYHLGNQEFVPDAGNYTNINFAQNFNLFSPANQVIVRGRNGFITKCVFDVALKNTRVELREDNAGTTPTAVLPIYRNFIIGRVTVGWGDSEPANITGKAKEVNLQFVITPLE